MSKEISKQEKEDYLNLMYEMKRKENQIVKSDLSRELEVPLSRVTRVTDGLLEEGYLFLIYIKAHLIAQIKKFL